MQTEIKAYEGEDLQELINKAKEELGENIRILYYEEIFETVWWLPFKKKKKFKLFVEKEDKQKLAKETFNFEEILEKVESIVEEKLKTAVPKVIEPPPHIEAKKNIHYEQLKDFTGEALDLIEILLDKGVDIDVAKKVIEPACGLDLETGKMDLNEATFKEAIIKGIKNTISFIGDFNIDENINTFKIIAFVGPTGVGKTTNLFKIASEFILKRDLKVGVISTDTFKVGAIQQARYYANILNIPFFTIGDAKKLRKTLLELADIDIVLIDTVGRSHYDAWKLGEVKEILRGGFDWMEATLTISCNYNPEESLNIVNSFRSYFPVKSLFFTKIDETSKPGLILNLPVITGLPVSYISTGQRAPEDLEVLTPELIASYILGEKR